MLSKDYRNVKKEAVAEDKSVRWVLGKPEGTPNFALRVIEFDEGAVFPTHHHPYEHEIFVLEGEGVAHVPGKEVEMKPGVAIYIPPSEPHGYRNTGKGVLRFICVIPHIE